MVILYSRWLCNIIDQACSVKMAGYWPSYLSVFLWTKTKLSMVNKNAAKNESNPAIFTEQAWPIKDFTYDQTKVFLSAQEHRTHLILQAHGTSHNYNNGQ